MKRFLVATALLLCIIQQLLTQTRPVSALVGKEVQSKIITPIDLDYSGASESKKSVVLAVVASLILPGMGELYAGSFESGKYNLIAEGGLWLTYSGFRMHADWLQQDARTFANQHAGANFDNKDDQYSVNIGNYNTTDEYNQAKLRNRENDLVYTAGQYQWQWDSDANRTQFKDLRIRSGEIRNNAKFFIGAVVINHLFSAFSAGRKAAAYNKSLSMMDNIEIQTFTLNNGTHVDGIGLSISTKF
ncbi:MAG: hypothetical protein ABR936_13260 [Bacteroidota bacterium]|jgi:hypothetical protein